MKVPNLRRLPIVSRQISTQVRLFAREHQLTTRRVLQCLGDVVVVYTFISIAQNIITSVPWAKIASYLACIFGCG